MRELLKLKKYVIRYKFHFLFGVLALITIDLLQLIIPRVLKWAVDGLATGTADLADLGFYFLIIVLIAVGIAIGRFFWRYLIIGSSRTSAGLDLYYTNRFWDYYTKRDIGFAGRVSFPFYLDYTRLGHTLRAERTQILDIAASYTPPSSGYSLYDDTIPKWTVSNSFVITRDSRDFIFNPTSGSYMALRAEVAKKFLFANVDYNRFTFEARTYLPIYWKFVLMGRIKAGVVTSTDEVPLYKRFYAGGVGDDGVRGYSDRSLSPEVEGRRVGGSALLINNLELKLKLSPSLSFLAFYDAGNAFESYKDVNLHNLYRGIGVGVRIEIPMMGILGFDMGYGLDREQPGFEPHFQINPFGMF